VYFSSTWVTILILTKPRDKDKKEKEGMIKGREKRVGKNGRDGG
jgi:hypothetical protein